MGDHTRASITDRTIRKHRGAAPGRLTNALKHANPAQARVLVRYGDDLLELEVADTGAGASNGGGSGHGLAGMRERVAVFGGELESGPRSGGGYSVRATLPL
jgi:signal transduction histidine kinase